MSGADVKRQLKDALDGLYHYTPLPFTEGGRTEQWDKATAALAPCVVLTAEEAEGIIFALTLAARELRGDYELVMVTALDLLTPEAPDA